MKVSNFRDIWSTPVKFGARRSCVGCNQLVLRRPKHGPRPKYCTEACRDRHDRKLRYLRYKEKERQRVNLWKQSHPERVKAVNDYHNNARKVRKQWKYSYLESLKV